MAVITTVIGASLYADCLTCGHSLESAGTDESSRCAIAAFVTAHEHKAHDYTMSLLGDALAAPAREGVKA